MTAPLTDAQARVLREARDEVDGFFHSYGDMDEPEGFWDLRRRDYLVATWDCGDAVCDCWRYTPTPAGRDALADYEASNTPETL